MTIRLRGIEECAQRDYDLARRTINIVADNRDVLPSEIRNKMISIAESLIVNATRMSDAARLPL
jgi:hypothetical protein